MPRTRAAAAEEPQEEPTAAPPPEDTPPPAEDAPGVAEGFDHDNGRSPVSMTRIRPAADEPPLMAGADGPEQFPLSVWEAIAEVTRRVGGIAKTRETTGGGERFKFRGIDDVLAALHPILGDVGLVILPGRVIREEFTTRQTKSGGTLNVARLLVRYRFIGPDGTTTSGEAWGESGDSGDKATQKAHSQSYKSLTLQTFSIPTEQSVDDEPDSVHEEARPFTAEEVTRATTAARAGEETTTVEGLAGVRRRALHLLSVPVPCEDGSVVPLGVIFEQRLRQLESIPAGGEPR
jgi:ERF superfamily